MIIHTKAGEYELTHAVEEAYRAIYPTADQEFARMTIWLESHKSRRPAKPETAMRFVNAWFAKVPKRVSMTAKTAAQVGTISHLIGSVTLNKHERMMWHAIDMSNKYSELLGIAKSGVYENTGPKNVVFGINPEICEWSPEDLKR